jgi:hypothetical protein
MSDNNIATTHRWFEEVWNQGRAETITELLAENAVAYGFDSSGQPKPARTEFTAYWTMVRQAMSDIHMDVPEVIGQGNTTAARFVFTGKHTGPYLGAAGTNKPVRCTGMVFLHWENGRIIAGWTESDILSLTIQTGAIHVLAAM